jgi:hypothetical protein
MAVEEGTETPQAAGISSICPDVYDMEFFEAVEREKHRGHREHREPQRGSGLN